MSLLSAGPLRLKVGPHPEGAISREGPRLDPDPAVGRDVGGITRDHVTNELRDPLSEDHNDRGTRTIRKVIEIPRLSEEQTIEFLRERRKRAEFFENATPGFCDNHRDSPGCH
jgi:hypothetical protein